MAFFSKVKEYKEQISKATLNLEVQIREIEGRLIQIASRKELQNGSIEKINHTVTQFKLSIESIVNDASQLKEDNILALTKLDAIAKIIANLNISIETNASSLEEMASSLEEMAAQVEEVANNTTQLHDIANNVSESIQEIAASIEQVANNAIVTTASVDNVATAMNDIAAATAGLAENATSLTASALETNCR